MDSTELRMEGKFYSALGNLLLDKLQLAAMIGNVDLKQVARLWKVGSPLTT
jgi:hypothetical protein